MVIAPADYRELWAVRDFTFCHPDPSMRVTDMLTLRPDTLDDVDPADRLAHWAKVHARLTTLCTRLGFRFTATMVRETVDPIGNGEHVHYLLHVPPPKRAAFKAAVLRWPGRNHLRTASYETSFTSKGKRRCAFSYISKVAHPTDRRRDKAIWFADPCPVWGWRVKTTTNLRPSARERANATVRATRRIATEKAGIQAAVSSSLATMSAIQAQHPPTAVNPGLPARPSRAMPPIVPRTHGDKRNHPDIARPATTVKPRCAGHGDAWRGVGLHEIYFHAIV